MHQQQIAVTQAQLPARRGIPVKLQVPPLGGGAAAGLAPQLELGPRDFAGEVDQISEPVQDLPGIVLVLEHEPAREAGP